MLCPCCCRPPPRHLPLWHTLHLSVQKAKWTLRTVDDATSAFVAIAGLSKAFPAPPRTDAPAKLASKLGLTGQGFEQPKLSAAQQAVLNAGFVVGQACINAYAVGGELGVSLPTGWSEWGWLRGFLS